MRREGVPEANGAFSSLIQGRLWASGTIPRPRDAIPPRAGYSTVFQQPAKLSGELLVPGTNRGDMRELVQRSASLRRRLA